MILPPTVFRAASPFLLASGFLFGSLAACESDPRARSIENREPDLVDVLHTDSTNQQAVSPGMLVAFDLPAHAGTGYSWELLGSSPEFVDFVGDPVFTPRQPRPHGLEWDIPLPGRGDGHWKGDHRLSVPAKLGDGHRTGSDRPRRDRFLQEGRMKPGFVRFSNFC